MPSSLVPPRRRSSKVSQDEDVPPEEKRNVDEELGTESEVPVKETQSQGDCKTKRFIFGFLLAIATIALIVGLSVGLTRRNEVPTGGGEPADINETFGGDINFYREHYEDLHGDKDHMEEYHPEDETFQKLLKTYKESPVLFKTAVNKIYFQNEATEFPRYPEQARDPGFVASIPTIPESEQEGFKAKYLNRTKSCPDYRRVQEIQLPRWNWASDNLDILVNQLRLSNFSDDQITDMFNGLPMWVQDKDLFYELRQDLSLLALKLEEENNWINVGFVFTGSSVNGFSQNPCKGLQDIPTWITSAQTSDVDIAIHADGLLQFAAEIGWTKYFPTTIDEFMTSVRIPIWESDAHKFGDGMVEFYERWSNLIPGGLQLTAYEDHNGLPPWEIRAVYGRRREMSYGE